MIEVKSPIRHNGRLYRKVGELITDITPEEAAKLVEVGAADWMRIKPESAVLASSEPETKRPAVDVDWESEVKQYHRGFGNYDIPGAGIVKGKDAAIEALRRAQTKG